MASPGSVRTLRQYDPYHMAWNTKRAHGLGNKPGEGGGGYNPREGYIFCSHAHRDWGTLQHRALFKRGL